MGSHMPDSTAMQLMMKPTGADEVDGYRQPYRWTGDLESIIVLGSILAVFLVSRSHINELRHLLDETQTRLDELESQNNLGNNKQLQQITNNKQYIELLQKDIAELQDEQVPIGFIYVQYPGQLDPDTIWPKLNWENVTPKYAGLFFRAEGGNSIAFDNDIEQDENSPRPGTWSKDLFTGKQDGLVLVKPHDPLTYTMKFMVSGGEVRPRNRAVRIWKRVE
ncbi:unnamed protein product [Oppiella nova]|uniref:Uncharacterized protein n=1 Tax=Oppiella nova TaxID=334625 RepID=A0A7R9MP47_9ACAR|nr:unnamed protein product [Oppiella nova]CAG2179746.1 unnamed protein product [Oppiella nova]